MSAATVDGTLFSNASWPRRKVGTNFWVTTEMIAATSTADAGDIVRLFPIEDGQQIVELALSHADLDSGGGNLDMDVVLVDDNGTTILFNAGTGFNAARTTPLIVQTSSTSNPQGIKVEYTGADTAYIGLLVNVAASTPAEGTVTLRVTTFS